MLLYIYCNADLLYNEVYCFCDPQNIKIKFSNNIPQKLGQFLAELAADLHWESKLWLSL